MTTLTPETERRLQNLNNLGTVKEINGGKVRVQIGENLTGWIPFSSGRSGGVKFWNPPSIGEQVEVTSPTGELETAYAKSSIPSTEYPNPSDDAKEPCIHMPDGAVFSYNHESSTLTFSLPENSQIILQGKGITVTVQDCNINAQNTTITGDSFVVAAANIDLNGVLNINGQPFLEHHHLNVKAGPDLSGGVAP